MPSRASKPKRPRDTNQLAAFIVKQTTDPDPEQPDTRNPAAVALSKLGASKGGKARAAKLSPARRAEIARLGGLARQKGRKKRKKGKG